MNNQIMTFKIAKPENYDYNEWHNKYNNDKIFLSISPIGYNSVCQIGYILNWYEDKIDVVIDKEIKPYLEKSMEYCDDVYAVPVITQLISSTDQYRIGFELASSFNYKNIKSDVEKSNKYIDKIYEHYGICIDDYIVSKSENN